MNTLTENPLALNGTHDHVAGRALVFVIEALTVGGAEQMLVAMANRLSAEGWPVHLICLTKAGELAANLDSRICLLYTSPSPRDRQKSRMPSSA